jgi:uncharacterized protein YecE (DUF72 family)
MMSHAPVVFDLLKASGTVELNAPFYGWPTVATVKTWLRQAQEDFVYTIKVSELITISNGLRADCRRL